MKKMLIIGSKGMLGSKFMELNPEGFEVAGVDYPEIDITKQESIKKIVHEYCPDFIVNCAAYTDVDGCESKRELANSVNGEGPGNVAEICRQEDIILVHISTDYVFNGKKAEGYKEGDKPDPESEYGRSKLTGEEAVREKIKKHYIVRTAWLFGENGNNFVETMIKASKNRDYLKVVKDQIGSPTYTKDLAVAIVELIKKGSYGIYHISNEGKCSWYEFAQEIFKVLGYNIKVYPCTTDEFPRPAKRPAYSLLSKQKIKGIGIDLRDWKSALKEYLSKKRLG